MRNQEDCCFQEARNGFFKFCRRKCSIFTVEYLKKKADEGESFIVVGRCAETVLGDRPNVISLFVLGDSEVSVSVSWRYMICLSVMHSLKWSVMTSTENSITTTTARISGANSRAYDLCINSSRLGFDETVNELEDYINRRRKMFK